MRDRPPFSSYLDFFSNVREGDTPSHTHPLRTFNLPSGTPLYGEDFSLKLMVSLVPDYKVTIILTMNYYFYVIF